MKISLFYHSLVSDWNHGNAHFLRGIVNELLHLGHTVQVYEPEDGWSRTNLIRDHGLAAISQFHHRYPLLRSQTYDQKNLNLNLQQVAVDSDVIIVHEWNEPWLVNSLGELRNRLQQGSNSEQSFRLLFHDTHHRAVSDPEWLQRFNLQYYDGVLAFGEVLSRVYRAHGWSQHVWTWHEAADTRTFYPREQNSDFPHGDVVWIGNWGDDERSRELNTFLFEPVRALGISSHIYGVRYPQTVLDQLHRKNIQYCGWLANFNAPDVFANHKVTVHIPRKFYRQTLPGIPTIRPFEAMACGIPLVSAPWSDAENLFTAGEDYLVATTAAQMQQRLRTMLRDRDFAKYMTQQALATIQRHHTCQHRVDQLLHIFREIGVSDSHSNKMQRHARGESLARTTATESTSTETPTLNTTTLRTARS